MNQTERVLLQAIQKSLWKTDCTFPEDADWNAVLKEAEDQTVLGIVIGVAPKTEQRDWVGNVNYHRANFIRILHCQEQLYALLRENRIPMVVLKGTAATMYYPNPFQRTMGDIDYIVPPASFDAALEALRAAGYAVEDDPREHRHVQLRKDGVSFEQHRYFSSEGIEVEAYVTEGLLHPHMEKLYGSEFPALPTLANGLVLLGHMVQHLRNGLGLRQVIDWMMYVDRELDDLFWDREFRAAAAAAGLEQAAVAATRMCQLYLGLSDRFRWCRDADEALCADLMESLLSSGNFDRKRGKGSAIETVTSKIAREGLFRHLQATGEANWKALRRHAWLKPFAWLYQGCRYIGKALGTERSPSQIRDDMDRGKRRNELYQKLKIGRSDQ